ncbi:MAG TPA: HPr family phosphocarrier protein [Candidatus Dorea intestinavium]|nr:HPr family phosphocarrier protein [Candidatus Dorea intestinavium]
MVAQKIVITNPTGLHLRPAGIFCNTAGKFHSKVEFKYGDSIANAKSVLSVLGACIKKGDEIEIICNGEDEEEALAAMIEAIKNGLGE